VKKKHVESIEENSQKKPKKVSSKKTTEESIRKFPSKAHLKTEPADDPLRKHHGEDPTQGSENISDHLVSQSFRRTSSAQTSIIKKRVKLPVIPMTKEEVIESQALQALTLVLDPTSPRLFYTPSPSSSPPGEITECPLEETTLQT